MVVNPLNRFKFFFKSLLAGCFFVLSSCSTIDSTVDSTWESISNAGDYLYDTIAIWEDDEPEQSEAIIIEEAIEVPEYALPQENFPMYENDYDQIQQSQNMEVFPQQNYGGFYSSPIYTSQRQFYYVGPNGTPVPAPPPPPFPQYSIDQQNSIQPFSNYSNLPPVGQYSMPNEGMYNSMQYEDIYNITNDEVPLITNQANNSSPNLLSEEDKMELYAIQNDCIRVVVDYMNGGYQCDDFDNE